MKSFLLLLCIVFLFAVGFIFFHNKKQLYQNFTTSTKLKNITPTATPTPFPFSIPTLQERSYTPSIIHTESTVGGSGNFTSSVISFTVDGLKEYALLNVPGIPKPAGGYPVVIIDHGYIDPHQYNTVTSYKGTGDYFASQGYLVLKPDYRGNANSAVDNDALKRFAYPIDVLTLLASLKNISDANPQKVYLWGHSMGGEVTLEVLEVLGKKAEMAKGVKAVVLWAPVTDPIKWFEKSHRPRLEEAQTTPSPYADTVALLGEPTTDSSLWKSLSPLQYLQDIVVPIQLNHGTADPTVPYTWSEELSSLLKQQGKDITLVSYPNADHNLSQVSAQAYRTSLTFFQTHE